MSVAQKTPTGGQRIVPLVSMKMKSLTTKENRNAYLKTLSTVLAGVAETLALFISI